jgi:hypothetical protein
VGDTVATAILAGTFSDGDTVTVDVRHDHLVVVRGDEARALSDTFVVS